MSRPNHTLVPMTNPFRLSRLRLGVMAGVAALGVAAASMLAIRDNAPEVPRPAPAAVAAQEETADFATEALARLASDSGTSSERPVYRYSVVPGGTYTEGELQSALDADPVVAAHYKQLDRSRVRKEVVARDRLVHVSYRKGNDVFWTKKKVLLRQGETILTDGKTQVRARCGNCIADEALGPTSEDEPDAVEFDRLVDGRPVSPAITALPVAVAPAPKPEEPLASRPLYPPFTPGSGLMASGAVAGRSGSSAPTSSGTPGGGGGAGVPLARANAAGTHEPGEPNEPGSNSTANGVNPTPGDSPGPQPPAGDSPQPPGGNTPDPQQPSPGNSPSPGLGGDQPAVDVPIPGGDDPIPTLEEITLIPTGSENPGPEGPGNPTTNEVPPGGQAVNPMPSAPIRA